MSATVTLTATTGSELSAAIAGMSAVNPTKVYKTTNAALYSASPLDLTASGWTSVATKTAASFTQVIYGLTPGSTVYIAVDDGTNTGKATTVMPAAGEIQSDFVPASLGVMENVSYRVNNQNSYGAKDFSIDINSGKHTTVILLQTANEMTDTTLKNIFVDADVATITGADPLFQILAKENVTDETGYTPYISGYHHLKYKSST